MKSPAADDVIGILLFAGIFVFMLGIAIAIVASVFMESGCPS